MWKKLLYSLIKVAVQAALSEAMTEVNSELRKHVKRSTADDLTLKVAAAVESKLESHLA